MNDTSETAFSVADRQPAPAPLDMPRQVLERDWFGNALMAFSRLFMRNA